MNYTDGDVKRLCAEAAKMCIPSAMTETFKIVSDRIDETIPKIPDGYVSAEDVRDLLSDLSKRIRKINIEECVKEYNQKHTTDIKV